MLLLLCGVGGERRTVAVKKPAVLAAGGVLAAVFACFTLPYGLSFFGNIRGAYALWPFDLSLAEERLQACADLEEAGEIAEPLPTTYATFEKDGYYIQANRFGTDAYEMAGVPLPTDLEDYSTRSGVQDSVPEGTVFDYDDYGNYAAQFIQEDGQLCYYVLLQGEESFGSIYLTAPKDQFDADTVAQWLSGSVLE